MMRSAANLLKKSSAASLLLLASQLILFLTTKFNSDALGPDGYGLFGLAMSASVCASQFVQWGLDQLLTIKFVRGSPEDSRHLYGIVLRQKQLAAIVAILSAAVAAWIWEPHDMIFLGAIDGVVIGFAMPSPFDARGRTPLFQFYTFLRHAAYVASVLLVAAFYRQYFSPLMVLSLHLLAAMLEIVLEQFWIQKNYGLPSWPVPVRNTFPLLRESAPMALSMLALQASFYLGPPALGYFGKSNEMGDLYLSNQFSYAAASFIAAPAAIVHARLAAHSNFSQSAGAAFRKKVWLLTCAFAAVGIAYSIVFDFAAERIAEHFFKNYRATPGILRIDAWRLAPIFAVTPLASALLCRGRLRAFSFAHIAALISALGFAAALIPQFGAPAAAGAVVGGRVAFLVLCAILFAMDKHDPVNADALK